MSKSEQSAKVKKIIERVRASRKVSPARRIALEVGILVRVRSAYTHEVLDAVLKSASISAEERAFATKLALGVTMSWGTLDEVLNKFLKDPRGLRPEVRDALRISTYEILFLHKRPHAAVDQGVELVRCVASGAVGLANAVLRRVVSDAKDFPFGDTKLSTSAFARAYAFPLWMTKMLLDTRGRLATCHFLEASNETAPLYVAENLLVADREEILQAFELSDAQAKQFDVVRCGFHLERCWRVHNQKAVAHPAFRRLLSEEKLVVSDASSQLIAQLAMPFVKPQRFLEIGAGRATKSILLQNAAVSRFGEQVHLESLDDHEFKAEIQRQRAKLSGVELHRAHVLDAQKLSQAFEPQSFDTIFIDAPCSGLGTLRRHPEIRWRITRQDIDALARLNLNILHEAARCLSVRGVLTYATCTLTYEENEGLVQRFLKSRLGEDFKLRVLTVPVAEQATAEAADGAMNLTSQLSSKTLFTQELRPGGPDAHFAVQLVRVRA